MTYDSRFEEARGWFLKYACEALGQERFEEVSGELWLRRSIYVALLDHPPEKWPGIAQLELRTYVPRFKRAENDFFNRQRPGPNGPKLIKGLE
jgi:hypothetical protein